MSSESLIKQLYEMAILFFETYHHKKMIHLQNITLTCGLSLASIIALKN